MDILGLPHCARQRTAHWQRHAIAYRAAVCYVNHGWVARATVKWVSNGVAKIEFMYGTRRLTMQVPLERLRPLPKAKRRGRRDGGQHAT